jgi:hypothetical protein
MKSDALAIVDAHTPPVGVGKSQTDMASDEFTLVGAIGALQSLIDAMNPNDLTRARFQQAKDAIYNAWSTVIQDNNERDATIASLQRQLSAPASTASDRAASLPATPTSGGVSSGAAAFIAIGSAVVGGIAGYAVRGTMEKKR